MNLLVKLVVQMIVILIVEENARGVVQTPVHHLVDTPVQVVVQELQNLVDAHLVLEHVKVVVIVLVTVLVRVHQNQVVVHFVQIHVLEIATLLVKEVVIPLVRVIVKVAAEGVEALARVRVTEVAAYLAQVVLALVMVLVYIHVED